MATGHDPWQRPARLSRSGFRQVGALRYHVREWGREEAEPVVLLHGGRDASATFQFLVDSLDGWRFVAPDWRGHGMSAWAPGGYWHADFVADLDRLLADLFGARPVRLIGHSMGANIASLYAGLRPTRVSRLVLLDAIGNMLDLTPVPIVETLLRLLEPDERQTRIREYADLDAMAERLRTANPRLDRSKSAFLAEHLSRTTTAGSLVWAKDPAFVRSFPTLHDTAEWAACWSRIEAPVLCLFASDDRPHAVTNDADELRRRLSFFRSVETATIPDTGHNLHHDAPTAVAEAVAPFLHR